MFRKSFFNKLTAVFLSAAISISAASFFKGNQKNVFAEGSIAFSFEPLTFDRNTAKDPELILDAHCQTDGFSAIQAEFYSEGGISTKKIWPGDDVNGAWKFKIFSSDHFIMQFISGNGRNTDAIDGPAACIVLTYPDDILPGTYSYTLKNIEYCIYNEEIDKQQKYEYNEEISGTITITGDAPASHSSESSAHSQNQSAENNNSVRQDNNNPSVNNNVVTQASSKKQTEKPNTAKSSKSDSKKKNVSGDINGDGTVDSKDIQLLKDHFLGKKKLSVSKGDADKNGKLDLHDLIYICKIKGSVR